MKLGICKGQLNVSITVFIQDSSAADGSGLTGLVYNSAGLSCYYHRDRTAAAQLSLATQTVTGAHSDGGFVEVDATNMPGIYRLDLSDAIVASGVNSVMVQLKGAANMIPVNIDIALLDFVRNTAAAGTLSTTQMTTNLVEATNDHYIGRTIVWTSGALQGQASGVTDYDGSSKMLTYNTVTDAPSANDEFILV